jgi:hypothetical protein
MFSLLSLAVTLNGEGYPFVVFLFFLLIVLYQLFSGKVLSWSWNVWATRENRPRAYWTVLAIESIFVLFGLYVGTIR